MFLGTIDNVIEALPMVFQFGNLAIILIGVLLGVINGALPGLSTTMALAVLLPLTFSLQPLVALLMLMGVYVGGMFGGSLSAILLNIPGTPSAIATSWEGFPMAEKGDGGKAIGYAAMASCFGGIIGAIILTFATPAISEFTLKFGYVEHFAVAVFGLSIMASLSGKHLSKGLLGGLIGFFTTLIGLYPLTNVTRLSFGQSYLLTGINLIPLMIGLFGIGEVINRISKGYVKIDISPVNKVIPTLREFKNNIINMIKSSFIGSILGAVPAVGGAVTCIVSYNEAKRSSKHPENFGKGAPEGIMAAESANNATACGAMVPLLTLGIPGDPQTAVLIGAFLIHNLRPGPMLFTLFELEVHSLFIAFFVASLFTFFVGILGAKYLVKVLYVPQHILIPIVAALCVVGSYSLNNNILDVYVTLSFGVLGFIFRKLNVPVAPVILGAMLGNLAEINLRTALMVNDGSYSEFFTNPISLFLISVAFISMFWPFIKPHINNLLPSKT